MYYERGLIKFAYVVWIYLAMVASHWRGQEPGSSSAPQARRPRRFLESHWSSTHIEKPNRMSSDAENDGDRSGSSSRNRSSETDTRTSKKLKQGKQAAFLKASFYLATIGRYHPLWGRVPPTYHHPPSISVNPSWKYLPRSTQKHVLWLNPDLINTTIKINHQNYNCRRVTRFSLKNGISSQKCHQLNKTCIVTSKSACQCRREISQGPTPRWGATGHGFWERKN